MTADGVGGGGGMAKKVIARNEPRDIRRRRLRVRRGIEKRRGRGENSSSSSSSSPEDCLRNEPVLLVAESGEADGRSVVTGDALQHGAVSVIGRRWEMEDAARVAVGFATLGDGSGYNFYGVYDGHGGSRVAEFCGERLHLLIVEELEKGGGSGSDGEVQWEKVMAESFARVDDEVRLGGAELSTMGSTAVVAVVSAELVVVANCGDSRAVICRDGVAVALSEDHKPNKPDELTRIQAAGGRVINWGGYRILGVLATSRSIGDQYLKPFVISDPEVRVSPRTSSDEFLILGSDGLWDVIPNEYACWVVRKCLKGRMRRKSQEGPVENRSAEAAAVLTELAIARGSEDNITVIVVELNTSKSRGKSP
ncbi:hypothetical protein MLD38_030434 [Melastoma candidum]|uniref:Uncharacterized protein n=1 Tax=Melastoma candidum TaxID=119954 RepID=A0ACB9MLM0_9MYRT|nr:hypothetical protein MLD38_030434 [Melastoma candidum]